MREIALAVRNGFLLGFALSKLRSTDAGTVPCRRKTPSANQECSMDARTMWPVRLSTLLWMLAIAAGTDCVDAARYETTNFVVNAPTPQLAQEVGETAEHWRRVLAIDWLGKEMPAWSRPCPIRADIAPHLGAGGVTTFVFDRGEVFDWRMTVTGSRERVLDSVLPHEITHTIFACHFRQPLPRWADEGACTTVEHHSEIAKQEQLLIRFLKTGKGIPFGQMFAMKDYPRDVLPLYAQGHSLTRFLIGQQGQAAFLEFLADGMNDENWPRAVREHYGHESLFALQNAWLDWVKQGRPALPGESKAGTQLASNTPLVQPATPSRPTGTAEPLASTNYESAYSRAARQHGRQVRRAATEEPPRVDAPTSSERTMWR